MMTNNEELAKEWAELIGDLISINSLNEADEEDAVINEEVEIESFERAGLLTSDQGIVIYMDGKEICITVQAFSR